MPTISVVHEVMVRKVYEDVQGQAPLHVLERVLLVLWSCGRLLLQSDGTLSDVRCRKLYRIVQLAHLPS